MMVFTFRPGLKAKRQKTGQMGRVHLTVGKVHGWPVAAIPLVSGRLVSWYGDWFGTQLNGTFPSAEAVFGWVRRRIEA